MGRQQRGQKSSGKDRRGKPQISKRDNQFRGRGRSRGRPDQRGRDRSASANSNSRFDRNNSNKFDRNNNKGDRNNKFDRNDKGDRNNKFDRNQSQERSQSRNKSQAPQRADREQRPNVKKGKQGKRQMGEFGNLVGKSIFKIVPEGQDGAEDKFAALNGEESGQEHYEEVEVEGEQPELADDYMEAEGEGQEDDEQDGEELEGEEGEQYDEEGEEEEDGEEQEDEEGDEDEQEGEGEQQQFEYEEEGEDEPQQAGDQQENQQAQEQQQGGVPMDDEEQDQNVDISVINLRIQETLQVLMNMPRLGQGKPRKHFVEKLKAYVHRYYGYNHELIDHFLNFLNPTEMVQFFEANETQRPLTIRTNTLKTRRKELAQFLIQRGVNLDPLAEWSKVGIKIYDTKVPIGATPEYLAGYYMLQSGSSFLPVLALDPQMNDKILDMASAPGGKTSYLAQIMKNTGVVFANDLKKDRLKALQFNISRLGITNTIVTCRDGRKYPEIFPNTFDRVLLDAPCTGLGIIAKDHSIKSNRVLLDIYKNSHVQKQLILAAIDCTKVGGVIVYSTCSVSPLENEEVINYALKKRFVKIVDMDDLVEVGEPGLIKFIDKRYHVDLRKTKRIYPHVHNMDGFYLGKLVKLANGRKQSPKGEEDSQQK